MRFTSWTGGLCDDKSRGYLYLSAYDTCNMGVRRSTSRSIGLDLSFEGYHQGKNCYHSTIGVGGPGLGILHPMSNRQSVLRTCPIFASPIKVCVLQIDFSRWALTWIWTLISYTNNGWRHSRAGSSLFSFSSWWASAPIAPKNRKNKIK